METSERTLARYGICRVEQERKNAKWWKADPSSQYTQWVAEVFDNAQAVSGLTVVDSTRQSARERFGEDRCQEAQKCPGCFTFLAAILKEDENILLLAEWKK